MEKPNSHPFLSGSYYGQNHQLYPTVLSDQPGTVTPTNPEDVLGRAPDTTDDQVASSHLMSRRGHASTDPDLQALRNQINASYNL